MHSRRTRRRLTHRMASAHHEATERLEPTQSSGSFTVVATNPNTRKRRVKAARQQHHTQAVSKQAQRRRRLLLWMVVGLAVAMVLPLAAGIMFTLLS